MITRGLTFAVWLLLLSTVGGGSGFAALIVNSAQTIDRLLEVQIIPVAKSDGTSAAPLFGTPAEQAAIFALVDMIWAQAGIDISFKFRLSPYQDTFTLLGNDGSGTRRSSDLNTIVANALTTGGILDPNSKVVNIFMVQNVPGFAPLNANTSAGFAFVNGNGVTLWAGPNLTSFAAGREVIASVLAHELGHNLGLNHTGEVENLMGSSSDGERLNPSQIATARSSTLVIPEPSAVVLALAGIAGLALRRRDR